MGQINLYFGWTWILVGLVSGTAIGLFFHDPKWLGGYDSWGRRLVRLGHISFLGTGLLNLAFVLSIQMSSSGEVPRLAAMLFLVGAITMPAVCFLSAWRPGLRRLFVIPVASLIVATADLLVRGL